MGSTSRRKLIFSSLAVAATTFSLPAYAFGLKSLTDKVTGGGGGGGSWSDIVKQWYSGLAGFGKQAKILSLAVADLADALGFKAEAASLRTAANKIGEKGDSLGSDDLDELKAPLDDATQKIIEDMKTKGKSYDAATKAKVAEAAAKYIPGIIGAIPHGVTLFKASQAASSAPTPGISDLEAGKVAAAIPGMIPNIFTFVKEVTTGANKFREVASAAEIAVPNDKIDFSAMSSG